MILDFGPPPARERYVPNDIGPSPETWLAPRLEQISTLITNGFVGTATPFYTDHTGVKYLYGQNVRQNYVDEDGIRYITKSFHDDQSKTRLRTGDILTVQSGHIGVTAVVPPSLDGANCHALIVTRLRKQYANPDFVSQYLNSEIGKARLRGLEVGSTILHINTKDLKKFRIPLPALAEQERIVELLKTWDRAIETVEALIATARAQKQALTQQLLSGKRRLPGFPEPWAWDDFADVFGRVKTKNAEGNTNVLTISAQHGLISQVEYFNKSVASDDVRGYTLLQRGDFAYNKSYSDGYPMGAIKSLDRYDSGIVSSLYICFRLAKRGFDHDFFRHYFEAGLFNREIAAIAQEGARNHGLLNVSVVEFFETSLHIPQPDEQAAIAKVINTAEAEERAYHAQLTALRQEKAALMQQLLTGKRRVKLPESENA